MSALERALARNTDMAPLDCDVFTLAFSTARADVINGNDTEARHMSFREEPAGEAGYLEGLASTRKPVARRGR